MSAQKEKMQQDQVEQEVIYTNQSGQGQGSAAIKDRR